METPIGVVKIERVDDIQGISLGQTITVWLSYILSKGDHRMNVVQGWVASLLATLKTCLGAPALRDLDLSDDRLCAILDQLGQNDAEWEDYERELNSTLLRVYDLKALRVRIDSTTAKSYVNVTEKGLFQFGHSKEHRPDLPQLKINQSALDPLGLPLSTTIVSGERAFVPTRSAQGAGQPWISRRTVCGRLQNGGTGDSSIHCS